MAENTWYVRLSEQRGRRRFWVEGARLLRAGVKPGDSMRVDFDDDHQLVKISVGDGARKVSQKTRRGQVLPVIDISNDALAEVFGEDVGRVRVVGANGVLEVSVAPDEVAERQRLRRGRQARSSTRPVRVGSLFHGLGVLDHAISSGLVEAGVPTELAWAVEAEGKYLDASVTNNPCWRRGGRAIQARVEEVGLDDFGPVDLLIAGIPCTGASLAGRSKNKLAAAEHHETAGSLFVSTLHAIKSAQPSVVVIENVVAYQSTLSMHVIRDVLGTWGYEIQEMVLSGRQFGAIEDRDRLVAVAVTRGMEFSLDWIQPSGESQQLIGDILDPISESDQRWSRFDYLRRKEEADIAAGKGFRMQVVRADDNRVGVLGRGYGKVRGTEPKLAHPSQDGLMRQFTAAEHARLKGIPESLISDLPETVAHEALGQSVIFPAFRAVGRALAGCFGKMLSGVPSQYDKPVSVQPVPVERVRAADHGLQMSLGL